MNRNKMVARTGIEPVTHGFSVIILLLYFELNACQLLPV